VPAPSQTRQVRLLQGGSFFNNGFVVLVPKLVFNIQLFYKIMQPAICHGGACAPRRHTQSGIFSVPPGPKRAIVIRGWKPAPSRRKLVCAIAGGGDAFNSIAAFGVLSPAKGRKKEEGRRKKTFYLFPVTFLPFPFYFLSVIFPLLLFTFFLFTFQ
jgi:hypothetical protein